MNNNSIENKDIEQLSDDFAKAALSVVKYARETFSTDVNRQSVIQFTESWFDLAMEQFNFVLRDIKSSERKRLKATCPSCGKLVNTAFAQKDSGRLRIAAYLDADGLLSETDVSDVLTFGPFELICGDCGCVIAGDHDSIEKLVDNMRESN